MLRTKTILFTSLIALSACNSETTTSEFIDTGGMWARIEVTSDNSERAQIDVELNAGGAFGTNIELSSGDFLDVSADGGERLVLGKDVDLLEVDYEGSLPITTAQPSFSIRLLREEGEDATGNTVVLPELFELFQPTAGASIDSNQIQSIIWTPPANPTIETMRISISTRCSAGNQTTVFSESVNAQDNGRYDLDMSTIEAFSSDIAMTQGASCVVGFTLRRSNDGVIDPAFDPDSLITATRLQQVRDIPVNLVP